MLSGMLFQLNWNPVPTYLEQGSILAVTRRKLKKLTTGAYRVRRERWFFAPFVSVLHRCSGAGDAQPASGDVLLGHLNVFYFGLYELLRLCPGGVDDAKNQWV